MGRVDYKAPMNVHDTLTTTLSRHDLLPVDATLLVGVSGGTDSLALLHLLAQMSERLHVATLDHGLRGAAGAADARFVVETAQAWGVPVTAGSADVRALAEQQRIGIEAAARIARYDFFASVAHEIGAARIAVAHNADDQVETVLMHLLRGSGLSGLAGMGYAAPLPGHPDLTLIRPLLDVPRADLAAYCRENGLQPRHDASNEDTAYRRNRLRRELIPYLRELSPQIERRLRQLAEIAALEDDFADAALHTAIDPHVIREDERIRFPRTAFASLHPALRRRFVLWAARALDAAGDVGYGHVTAAVELALSGQVGARAQLKGGVQLRVDYETLVVEREDTADVDDLPLLSTDAAIPVALPGVTRINEHWSLRVSLTPLGDEALRLAIGEGSTLVLRGRRAGDQFAPLGLGGHTQKLSEWMIDHKVPRQFRARLPLIVSEESVAALWWNGWKVNEAFAETPESGRVIYAALEHNN